jgi:hypothetical protein
VVNEHHYHVYQPDKSAITEYGIDLGHQTLLKNTSILARKSRCKNWLIREVTEV